VVFVDSQTAVKEKAVYVCNFEKDEILC